MEDISFIGGKFRVGGGGLVGRFWVVGGDGI